MTHRLPDMPPGATCIDCHGEGTTVEPCEGGEQEERCSHCGGGGTCDCDVCLEPWDPAAAPTCARCGDPLLPDEEDFGTCTTCAADALLEECQAALSGPWDLTDHGACYLRDDSGLSVCVQRGHGGLVLAAYSGDAHIMLSRPSTSDALCELHRRVIVDPWPWAEPTAATIPTIPRPVAHESARIFADALERGDAFTTERTA